MFTFMFSPPPPTMCNYTKFDLKYLFWNLVESSFEAPAWIYLEDAVLTCFEFVEIHRGSSGDVFFAIVVSVASELGRS